MQLGNGRYYDKIISSKSTSENQNIRQSFVVIHEYDSGKKSVSILMTDFDHAFLLAADIKMNIYYRLGVRSLWVISPLVPLFQIW